MFHKSTSSKTKMGKASLSKLDVFSTGKLKFKTLFRNTKIIQQNKIIRNITRL